MVVAVVVAQRWLVVRLHPPLVVLAAQDLTGSLLALLMRVVVVAVCLARAALRVLGVLAVVGLVVLPVLV